MCAKYLKESGMLFRVLLVSLCLLLLAASQLAAWPIRPAEDPAEQAEPPQASASSTPVIQWMLSTTSSDSNARPPKTESQESPNLSTLSQAEIKTALQTELEALKAELAAAEQTEAIEDALAADLAAEAGRIADAHNQQATINAEQADRIADLEQEAKSKAYLKIGGVIGFEDSYMPTWGLSFTIGSKIGRNILLEAGAEYDIGTLSKPLQGLTDPALNRLRITTAVGWLF